MKKITLITLLICLTVIFSYAQKVTVDFDKTVDMSNYKTFTFLGWQDESDRILNDFDKERLHDAFIAEFKKRNITQVEEGADMDISLYIVITKETSRSAYTTYMGGGLGRGYRGGGWGGGYSSTNYTENDYLAGTMVIDVYDPETKNLIWEAVATDTVSEKPQKREKGIPKAVSKLMKKFPVEPVKK
jgi:hypothetical protein